MSMKLPSLLIITLFALTACSLGEPAATGEQDDSQAAEAARSWMLDYALSGGFAGLMQQLSVTSDGRLVAVDKKSGRQVEKTLAPEQLRELDALLAQLEGAPAAPSRPAIASRCADCVEYRLQAAIDGERYGYTGRSGENMPPANAELNAYLASLLRQTLAGSD
jgi:hypothetical protein